MLSPEQVAKLSDPLLRVVAELEAALVAESARLVAEGAPASVARVRLETIAAQYPLAVQTAAAASVTAGVALAQKPAEALYRKAYAEGLLSKYTPDSLTARNVVTSYAKTAEGYGRIVQTAALESRVQTVQQALDTAALRVATGTAREVAVAEAVEHIGKTATHMTFRTEAGKTIRRELDSAVRQLVGTTAHQAALRVQEVRLHELGAEFVEVSAHGGARPEHAVWQGQVYRYDELAEKTGYGDGDGLGGWNCRHSWSPHLPGISPEPPSPPDLAENEITYNATQRQRQIERNISAYKRRLTASEAGYTAAPSDQLKAQVDRDRALVKKWQAEARANAKQFDLTRRDASDR